MNLENLELQTLSYEESQEVEGGNGVHSAGYGVATDQDGLGEFWFGFFMGFIGL